MKHLNTINDHSSTEERIIEAARKLFTQNGFSGTRTRDIASESGINLALLNYYFRSKEKLFEKIMAEKLQELFGTIIPILNDTETSFEKKIELFVETYIDNISKNPDIPIFVLREIQKNPEKFKQRAPFKGILLKSVFIAQLKERKPELNPMHFFLNLMGMTVFPFIARPMIIATGSITEKEFLSLVSERKKYIPIWINAMLEKKL